MNGGDMVLVNRRHVEVLKVWYALFTTLMDGGYSDSELIGKLRILDRRLRQEVPIEEIKAS